MTTTTTTTKTFGGQASADECREFARTATDTTDIMVAMYGAGASLAELAAVDGGIGMAAAVNIATNRDGSTWPREDARRAVARWIRYARAELELAST